MKLLLQKFIYLPKQFLSFPRFMIDDRVNESVENPQAGNIPDQKNIVLYNRVLFFLERVKSLGFTDTLEDYDKRKLGIFNLLNFFQLLTGLFVPLIGAIMDNGKLTTFSWYISSLPAFISVLVLSLNSAKKYHAALISYFLLYPFFTSIVYMGGINLGTELNFILYGILSVFFIQDISNMLFSVALSMISYFILSVVLDHYQYQLQTENIFLYILNQIIAILFIFYGLFLIKKENAIYQFHILEKNKALEKKNIEILDQKAEIHKKAVLLKEQTAELTELNTLKTTLFSVISHDLKSPMYALQSLFRNMQRYNVPAEDIKKMIPDIVNDLNYTTGLLENLLQWAKSQMQSNTVNLQPLDASQVVTGVIKLLRLQAEAKEITIESMVRENSFVLADKDMLSLVLRNLLSNAIKFTPSGGRILIETEEQLSAIRFFVKDTGIGMTEAALQKLNENNYYTTKGTASEQGTGLGLMLCKEFLVKHESQLNISSIAGEGTVFSFLLKREVL